jgi:hypothetical protein
MLFYILIFIILSNAVTLLDNKTFYYSRNINIVLIYLVFFLFIDILKLNGLFLEDNIIKIITMFILIIKLIVLNNTSLNNNNNNSIIKK